LRRAQKEYREWCGRLTGVWPLGHCTYEKGFYEWPSFGGNRDIPLEESPLFHASRTTHARRISSPESLQESIPQACGNPEQ